jgi:hypothetical protein
MKNRKLALDLELHKWIQNSILDIHVDEGLPQVLAVFIEMKHPSIQIYQHAYDCAYLECFLFSLPVHAFQVIVALPSLVVELITRGAVDAPDISLAR